MAKMNPTLRSVFAVIDGLLLFLALEGAFYAVAYLGLHRSFDTPTPLYLTCNFIWAVLAGGVAGFMAARVGRRSPILHGVGVAFPLILLSAFNFHKGVGSPNTPYVLLLNALVPIACLWGAFVAGKRYPQSRRPARA